MDVTTPVVVASVAVGCVQLEAASAITTATMRMLMTLPAKNGGKIDINRRPASVSIVIALEFGSRDGEPFWLHP
jgi:hypothetical protein